MTEFARVASLFTRWICRKKKKETKNKSQNSFNDLCCFSCRIGRNEDDEDRINIDQSRSARRMHVNIACCSNIYSDSVRRLDLIKNCTYVTI